MKIFLHKAHIQSRANYMIDKLVEHTDTYLSPKRNDPNNVEIEFLLRDNQCEIDQLRCLVNFACDQEVELDQAIKEGFVL